MNSKTSHSSTYRYEGCTLTGALSVTTAITDGISIIHGPAGCAHHNLSLIYATLLDHESGPLPALCSDQIGEEEIIFGGEEQLTAAIRNAVRDGYTSVMVLGTCVTAAIGDDIDSVCGQDWPVPVIPVKTQGFLGGVFSTGFFNALSALAGLAPTGQEKGDREGVEPRVNLIGEKNLEYEVDENAVEVTRLLDRAGIGVNLRFVRGIRTDEIARLGRADLNILREPSLVAFGEELQQRFSIPYLDGFPVGLGGTLRFIREAADRCAVDGTTAVEEEEIFQAQMLDRFEQIRGARVRFSQPSDQFTAELVDRLGLIISSDGAPVRLPVPLPVGTAGIRRMLQQWRRTIDA
jgi:nitrogenase molybdenum-iron protein alpha/beta subunit